MTPHTLQPPHFFKTHASLADRTYYGMGGYAQYLACPRSFTQVQEALSFAKAATLPVAVLGSGSNSVFADGCFEGVVISLENLRSWHWETLEECYLEAGVTNTEVAELCLAAGRAGAAWMYRMPGQLGATVRMNARCYGGEISQIVSTVITMDTNGRLKMYSASEVFRGYKDTLLMACPEIVLAVRLSLPTAASQTALLSAMLTCERDRHGKHHFDNPSCGSTFKNNYAVGKPSGRIFDELGLKGTRIGDASVSDHHANFVWNLGRAKSSDMLALAAHMRAEAKHRAQADLELEVQPIGPFSADLFERCGMNKLGPYTVAAPGESNAPKNALKNAPKIESVPSHNWVGLLWHPKGAVVADGTMPAARPRKQYPHKVFAAPFSHYHCTPGLGLTRVRVEIEQLAGLEEAKENPEAPFLQWLTLTDSHPERDFSRAPPELPGSFVDGLWQFSVSELFIASPSLAPHRYLELEVTPQLHWVALRFDGPRLRAPTHANPNADLWPGLVRVAPSPHAFGMTLSYSTVAELLNNGCLLVQAAASLGKNRYYLAPHWKVAPLGSAQEKEETWDRGIAPAAKPDFHQPHRFWTLDLRPD